MLAFHDIDRIEVLKGPQGTLFGRNTAAGAISIITHRPHLDTEADATVRIGNDGQRYFDALLNVPMTESSVCASAVSAIAATAGPKDAGTGRHYALDRQEGVRMVVGGDISEDWEMQLSWDHERLKEPQRLQIGVLPQLSNSSQRAVFPPIPATYQDPREVPIFNDTPNGRQTKGYDGGTLALTRDLDWATFTSTTAFSESDVDHFEDQDGTNNPSLYLDSGVTQSGRTYYQEFKFAGANDSVDWVAGASVYREEGRQSNIVNSSTNTIDTLLYNEGASGPCGGPAGLYRCRAGVIWTGAALPRSPDYSEQIDNQMTSDSLAVFGDVIWHVNDRLNLTAGLRYTDDSKEFSWFNRLRNLADELDQQIFELGVMGLLGAIPPQVLYVLTHNIVFPDAVGIPVKRDGGWDDLSPRVVVDYQFTDYTMGFVSVSKGYKAGGNDGVQIDSEYAPEEVWNYELGVKNTFPSVNMVLKCVGLPLRLFRPAVAGAGARDHTRWHPAVPGTEHRPERRRSRYRLAVEANARPDPQRHRGIHRLAVRRLGTDRQWHRSVRPADRRTGMVLRRRRQLRMATGDERKPGLRSAVCLPRRSPLQQRFLVPGHLRQLHGLQCRRGAELRQRSPQLGLPRPDLGSRTLREQPDRRAIRAQHRRSGCQRTAARQSARSRHRGCTGWKSVGGCSDREMPGMSPSDILIVDDNPANLDLLSGLLRERGFRFRVTTSGRRAILAAQSSKPALIMLDITMPDMDGYAVCTELKADPRTCQIPVIFISALDEAMDKVKAFRAGAADYVAKPFHFEEVMARIEHQLQIANLKTDPELRNPELIAKNELLEAVSRDLQKANDELASLSMTDALTGIPNRRQFHKVIEARMEPGATVWSIAGGDDDRRRLLQTLQRRIRPSAGR